ncbi:MAG: DUF4382 domain-containing protein [Thermoflavifilum sp.]|nr:DUF4382 domain-containing protein [Thermoflavifilum sp.]
MKNNKFSLTALLLAVAAVLGGALVSCQKSTSLNTIPPGKNQLEVRFTDDAGFFDSIVVDVQMVAVRIDTSQSNEDRDDHHPEGEEWGELFHEHEEGWEEPEEHAIWDTLNIQAGQYDLTQLSNGADTLLSSDFIPKGKIIAIRITLGDNNYLVKNGVKYPLNLFEGYHNVYIRIYGDQITQVHPGSYRLWIDFDAGRSVIKVRDGSFYLKPFIRAFVVSNMGIVQGFVLPMDAYPVITLYNNTDTLYALPRKDGFFKIWGVDAGTYSLFVNTSNGYRDTTISNIQVTARHVTDVGTIHLSK